MKRSRGRGRKPSNSLSRTMESNGPDVKVRGTAHQICDKYLALARDANVAGDRIAYEGYLQHAEHYHRIILLSQPANGGQASPQSESTDFSEEGAGLDGSEDMGNDDQQPQHSQQQQRPARARRPRRGRNPRGENGNGNGNGGNGEGVDGNRAEPKPAEAAEASEAPAAKAPKTAPAETA